MKTRKLIQRLAAGAIAVTFASGALAMHSVSHQRDTNAPLGMAAPEALADRVIKLGAGSESLDVVRGKIVTIVNGEKSFTWRFDTFGEPSFALAKIAPRDFGTGHIRVNVMTDWDNMSY